MINRPGNPHGAPRVTLTKISLMLDDETLALLKELEEDYGPNMRGRRSAVVRLAIHRAAGRIRK